MPPTLLHAPFHRDDWVYEEKYDGWRVVVFNVESRPPSCP
jgi:ATP-dependent DNA ligase